MEADSGDRLSEGGRKAGPSVVTMLVAVAIIAALAFWYFSREQVAPVASVPPVIVTPAAPPEPEVPPAPDIPPAQTPAPMPSADEPGSPLAAEPALTLEGSDAQLREQFDGSDSSLVADMLGDDNLIERSAATIDTFSRGVVLYKLLPVERPEGKFNVLEQEEGFYMDPASYSRYDAITREIEQLDSTALVSAFHQFRPLLEQAYTGLGYQADELDNALIRALDRILATPDIEEPIAVVRAGALYKFADPELEKRALLQKQLLRAGPENTRRMQAQARSLREALLAQ